MARYVCPYCQPRPLAMLRRPDGTWICVRCGGPLQRLPLVRPLPALAGLLLALGLGVTLLSRQPQRPGTSAAGMMALLRPAPEALAALSAPGGLEGIDEGNLLQQLEAADAAWLPRAEVLPDGRTRYHYKRSSGEPPLSLAEIRQRIAQPPTFQPEQVAIRRLLTVLARAGVRVQLVQPRKQGAAAEWDPGARTLRIKPRVVASGSREFARVMNHEAIHVAQSCSRGHLRAMPQLLGLSRQLPGSLAGVLGESVYSKASPQVRLLEQEAYANQHNLELGPRLVGRHCRLRDHPA